MLVDINFLKFDKCKIDEALSSEDIDDLAEDIDINGLMHPVTIDDDNFVIFGFKRFAACKFILNKKEINVSKINMSLVGSSELHVGMTKSDWSHLIKRLRGIYTDKQIIEITRLSKSTIYRYLKYV